MPSQQIKIPFPLGGLSANTGYESGDIQTTRGCLNVVPDSSEESRTRGGTRPGLVKKYNGSTGRKPTFAVRVSGGDNTRVYEYLVLGTSENIYIGQSQASGDTHPISYTGVLSALTGQLEVEGRVYEGRIVSTESELSPTPDYFTGTTKEFSAESGSVSFDSVTTELRLSDAGISDWTAETIDRVALSVRISGSAENTVANAVYGIESIEAGYIVLSGWTYDSGSPPAAGPESVTYDIIYGSEIVLYDFNVDGSNSSAVTNYRDTVIVNADDQPLSGFDTLTADSLIYNGTELRLTDTSVGDWTATAVDDDVHYVELTVVSGTATVISEGTYEVTSIQSGYLVLSGATPLSTATESATVSYSIKVGVRQINPNTPSIGVLSPAGGFVPMNADDVVSYRDRLVWAKNRTWYMSRQGNAGDYNYGADPEDPSRAIAGVSSGPGEPADPIIAMAPAGYDYLVFFSESAVWVMRGDPGYGGQLYQASSVAGCVSRDAWCYGDSTELYFLGKDGLYMMEPNAGAIRGLSQSKLPRKLRGIDRDNFDVSLAYDPEDNGVVAFIVPKDGSSGEHFYFDIETQSFWPFVLSNPNTQPIYSTTFGGDPTSPRKACIASIDGYVREWSGKTDDGATIQSNVIMGPYPVTGREGIDGILTELMTVTDKDSVDVTVEVYAAESSEEAVALAEEGTSPSFTFVSKAGRSKAKRPRIRGGSFCIKITASGVWAYEEIFAMIAAGGRNRRI